jgi:RimJ/RimL family protein N-acetyltransferase
MRFVDKKGVPFDVRVGSGDDLPGLRLMYEDFSPKGGFQGVPPVGRKACREWIGNLMLRGFGFLALRGDRVIGHLVIIPDPVRMEGEYLIFVDRNERNRGVGTCLTRSAVRHAEEMGLRGLWLTVGKYNFPAIALYLKFGFRFGDGDRFESERTMRLAIGEESCR